MLIVIAILRRQTEKYMNHIFVNFSAIVLISCSSMPMNEKPLMKASVQLDAKGVEVETEIENLSQKWLVLLRWNTPFDHNYPRSGVFEILDANGKLVPYTGRYISQIGLAVSDYIFIGPRGTVTQKRKISDGYEFPIDRPFSIRFNACVTYGVFSSKQLAESGVSKAVNSSNPGVVSKLVILKSNQVKYHRPTGPYGE